MITSAINENTMRQAYLSSVDDRWAFKIMKIKNGSGILFPYWSMEGSFLDYRLKMDKPVYDEAGKVIKKYHQKPNTSLTCYFLKESIKLLQDAKAPLLVTEGEKKLLSIESNILKGQYGAVSYPGVWNFKTRGEKKLSEQWADIPLDKRDVYWLPDTDIFSNQNVAQAGKLFLNLLVDSGATVHIVDLRKPDQKEKIGTDDFISRYSPEELVERINNPISVFSKYDKVYEFINKKPFSTPSTIFTSSSLRRKTLLGTMRDKIAECKNIYKYGSELIWVEDKKYETINCNNLSSVMSDLDIEFAGGTEERPVYKLLPPDLARTFCYSSFYRTGYKEISLFADHPVYNDKWELTNSGYDSNEGIYYSGEEIKPIKSLELINIITKDFLFKNRASLCNYLALLLTSVLRNKYRGDKPFGALSGNRPQIGKTLSCKLLSIVATGRTPETITYTSNQIELEKQMGARAAKSDILMVDNVKSQIPVESAVLEKLITDDPISFRELGTSRTITRPNTLITLITMNDAIFCQDLITRTLPIEFYLSDETDPSEIKYENDDLCNFVQTRRLELIQELCGMVETWKDKGAPICEKKFRFRRWAQDVGGILMANGFVEFLDNLETASALYDTYLHDIGMLFEDVLNQSVTASELIEICELKNIFDDIRETKKPVIAMAHLLSRYAGKKIPLSSGEFFRLREGRYDSHRGLKTYVAEQNQVVAGTAGTDTPF